MGLLEAISAIANLINTAVAKIWPTADEGNKLDIRKIKRKALDKSRKIRDNMKKRKDTYDL